MKILMYVAGILVLIGALNWGLVGLFEFNLVSLLFGEMTGISRLIYVLVGLSALWIIFDRIYSPAHK